MNKSSKLTKVLSVAIAVVMLLGVMACGMIANAADRGEWNASTQYNGGDTVTYQGGIYQAKYWTQGETPDPDNEWGAWRLIGGNPGNASTVTIKDGAGNAVSSASVGIEEGSAFFTATTTATSSTITWSITNNTCGATLNPNYNGGALVSFTKAGNVTLVATDANSSKAEVVIAVNTNSIQLNASTVNGPLTNGSTLEIEQGQAVEVLVDCTDPSKLTVNKSGTSVTVTQGSTGVPLNILGTAVGSSTITLELMGKTLAFTVNVKAATTANFTVNGSPIVGLTTVDRGATINVTCSLAVNRWVASNGDITVAQNGSNGARITGNNIGGIATVTAYNASNAVLGTFDVYVTAGNNGQFVEILDAASHTAVSTVNMKVGDTKQFIGDCTIDGGAAGTLTWELVSANPANCVTLTTGGNDGNGNVLATIKANAKGTVTLKATSKGISDTITITVDDNGGTIEPPVGSKQLIVMKKDMTVAYVDGAILPTTDYGNGIFAKCVNNNGTYCLPLRYIGENFGMAVEYINGQTRITNAAGEYVVVLKNNTVMNKYNKNGQVIATFNIPLAPYTQDGVTMVPMRAVSEALGLGVCYVSSSTTGFGSYVAISVDKNIDQDLDTVYNAIGAAHAMGL